MLKRCIFLLFVVLLPLSAHAEGIRGGGNSNDAHIAPTQIVLTDDFAGGLATSGSVGQLGWSFTTIGSAPAVSRMIGAANHPGLIQFATNASVTAGQGGSLWLSSSTASQIFLSLTTATNWDSYFTFSLSSTSDIRAYIGYGDTMGAPLGGASYIGVRLDASVPDTNFIFVCSNAGAATEVNSGITANTNYHTLRLRSVATGMILFSLDGGSEQSIATNCYAGDVSPAFQVLAHTTTQRSVSVDYFGFFGSGLSR